MTMSTSSAPAATASAHVGQLDRQRGPAGRERGGHRGDRHGAARQLGRGRPATRSGYTHTAATGGTAGSAGSGRSALAHRPRTLPGVSAPSSVVRSTMRTASVERLQLGVPS